MKTTVEDAAVKRRREDSFIEQRRLNGVICSEGNLYKDN